MESTTTYTAFSGAQFDPPWVTAITATPDRGPAPIYTPPPSLYPAIRKRYPLHGQICIPSSADVPTEPFDLMVSRGYEFEKDRDVTQGFYGITVYGPVEGQEGIYNITVRERGPRICAMPGTGHQEAERDA